MFPARRVRRHLFAVALATLNVQALVLALGLASVCGVPEHTHQGQAAGDCAMHHQAPPADQGHHGHAAGASHQAARSDAQIKCKCSSSVVEMYGGSIAVLEPETPAIEKTAGAVLASAGHERAGQARVPPPLPPPRLLSI